MDDVRGDYGCKKTKSRMKTKAKMKTIDSIRERLEQGKEWVWSDDFQVTTPEYIVKQADMGEDSTVLRMTCNSIRRHSTERLCNR